MCKSFDPTPQKCRLSLNSLVFALSHSMEVSRVGRHTNGANDPVRFANSSSSPKIQRKSSLEAVNPSTAYAVLRRPNIDEKN